MPPPHEDMLYVLTHFLHYTATVGVYHSAPLPTLSPLPSLEVRPRLYRRRFVRRMLPRKCLPKQLYKKTPNSVLVTYRNNATAGYHLYSRETSESLPSALSTATFLRSYIRWKEQIEFL